MADFTRRERVERHIEYVLDTEPYGTAIAEIGKAVAVAWRDYASRNRLDPDTAPQYDDWARVFTRDNEVVIRFTVEESSDAR